MEWLSDPQAWIALATLTVLEIVLGIDNIVFISILADKLPVEQRASARRLGLTVAMVTRIGLLLSIAWVMNLTEPFWEIFGRELSGKDLILLGGGLFLLWKATREIHEKMEEAQHGPGESMATATFVAVIVQIGLLDLVFSLDSVITAVGMADHIPVMILAIVIAVGVMILAAEGVSHFVAEHPTVKMLALSFLLLIGMALVAEALGEHIPKGYIYFAMGFSVFVETLNLRVKTKKSSRPGTA
jgi:predicted tellurium resistance membrane protein TerC